MSVPVASRSVAVGETGYERPGRGPAGRSVPRGQGGPGVGTEEAGTMMDDLRQMARAPVASFERFLGELQRITGDKTIAAPIGIERLKELQTAVVREIEESLQHFRTKVGEAEAALVGVLRPARPNLYEEIKRVVQHLQRLLDLAARRDRMLRAWEDQPADAIVEGYRAALERHEAETVEVYEVEAERALRRKGHSAALQIFLDLRAQAEEARLSPSQKQAKADLAEIERTKQEVTLATRVVASTLKVSGSIAAVGAGWRKGSRLRLDPDVQGQISVLILPGPHPGMTALLLDVSRAGMRMALPEDLPPGTMLNFVLKHRDGRDGELRMQGEVRWCRTDARTPGHFLAGVRLLPRMGDQWPAVLSRLAESQQNGRTVLESREP